VYEILKATLGPEHPDTLTARVVLDRVQRPG
jgi:hypothetical protein